MQTGKFNVILDCFWGSSGKGKLTAYLADKHSVTHVSSSNYPNAGHTAAFEDGTKFVAKAIPTAAVLKKTHGMDMKCFISPGSGFNWEQVAKEWLEAGKPELHIHERASVVTDAHKERERAGSESTKHIASTMQGTAAAMVDKILRKSDCKLARSDAQDWEKSFFQNGSEGKVSVVDAMLFRNMTRSIIDAGHTWLHEGSQGYALSIDHGSHYPHCTSRNCTLQASMDHMAVPPKLIGDVYLNLRTYPIRVGNVVEADGTQTGYSGDFYPDCKELTWDQVAGNSGMPFEEAKALAERERTTVTKRIRRVSTFSFIGLEDAVRTNGATKLCLNFVQYLDWKDAGLKGGVEAFKKLSMKTRSLIDQIEEVAKVPVVLVGTGPLHGDMIDVS
jgi:adenylosuccinate synthase